LEQWIHREIKQGGRGRGGRVRERRQAVSDEIQATLVDHVLVHGRTMGEGKRVQTNLSRFTVTSIIIFHLHHMLYF